MKNNELHVIVAFLLVLILAGCGFPKFRRYEMETEWKKGEIDVFVRLLQEEDFRGRPVNSDLYDLLVDCKLQSSDSIEVIDQDRAVALLRELVKIDSFVVRLSGDEKEMRMPIVKKLDHTDYDYPGVVLYSEYFPVGDSVKSLTLELLYNSTSDVANQLPLTFHLIRTEKREFRIY